MAEANTAGMNAAQLREHNDRLMNAERGFLSIDAPEPLYKRDEVCFHHQGKCSRMSIVRN